ILTDGDIVRARASRLFSGFIATPCGAGPGFFAVRRSCSHGQSQ
ncbi:unnamed protein product, partial [Amoebophrya sp. A120]